MAKYLVDMPNRLAERTTILLNSGRYATMSEFLVVAVENQLLLENSEEVQVDAGPGRSSAAAGPQVPSAQRGDAMREKLSLANLADAPGPIMLPVDSARLVYPGDESEEDLYLWGQVNRLFPVKVGLRLLWLMSQGGGPVALADFQVAAADAARAVGLSVKEYQDSRGVKRGDALWVGLPIGSEPEKSLGRYRSQFVGFARKDGVLEGAMFRLKLVGLDDDLSTVGFTEAGMRWAKALSPIIDRADLDGLPLSAQESFVYTDHVISNVPEERRPLHEVLSLVEGGAVESDRLGQELAKAHDDWSGSVVVTMKAGAVGRLWELGLLAKEGGHGSTTFSVTTPGREFLERCERAVVGR